MGCGQYGGLESSCLRFPAFCRNLRPMSREEPPRRRSALLSFRFIGTAVVGSIVMALVAAFGPPAAQLAVLGAFISVLGGLFLSYLGQEEQREQKRAEVIESLSVPLSLASDRDLFRLYQEIAQSLIALSKRPDPVLGASPWPRSRPSRSRSRDSPTARSYSP